MSHYVYRLLDYKKKVFYVGITKNLDKRIEEHARCKNSFPAKTYRVRRSIKAHNGLLYDFLEFDTIEEARSQEREWIIYYKHQLVNKQYGKTKSGVGRKRKQGRSKKCPTCGIWFRQINKHVCKGEKNERTI